MGARRAWPVTRSSSYSSIGATFTVGGMTPSLIASRAAATSSAPAPESPACHRLRSGDRHAPWPEDRRYRRCLGAIKLRHRRGVGEHHTDISRGVPGVRQRQFNGAPQRRRPRAAGPRVERRRVTRELSVHTCAAPDGGRAVLDDEDRAAFPRHVPACPGIEREIRAIWLIGWRQSSADQLGCPSPRADGAVHTPGEHEPCAPAYPPASLGDGVQAPCLVADHDTGGAAHPVTDGDLAGIDRVEPGERLIAAHMAAALAPQVLELTLPEFEAARRRGGRYTHLVFTQSRWVNRGILKREVCRHQRQSRHVVGLRQQPARQAFRRDETRDFPCQPGRIAGRVKPGHTADPGTPPERRRPVLRRPETVGGRHPDASDEGCHRPGAPSLSRRPGSASTIAL